MNYLRTYSTDGLNFTSTVVFDCILLHFYFIIFSTKVALNSIRATQTGLSQTLLQTSRHVEMVCVRDFPHREVSVKVGIMEFGLCEDLFVYS